ncbi:hypothetical protein [Clostridioides difficile]|uniref:hypothetical protein n=1 Tax=Clostridioides difficile TaxID=1496 RepID=UPI0005174A4C|nr:hypothetical protein [Clostridioides difficile]
MKIYYYWDPDTKQFNRTVISDKEIRDANATTDSLDGLCQPIYRDTKNNKWIGSDNPGINATT